jgi:hypothetical protein
MPDIVTVSLSGPIEESDGELVLLIPLSAGGYILAATARGIGQIEGNFLKVTIPPWLAAKLEISAGSIVNIDNTGGKFNITPQQEG